MRSRYRRLGGSIVWMASAVLALSARTTIVASADRGPACRPLEHAGSHYTVCECDASRDEIGLYLDAADGRRLSDFARLEAAVAVEGRRLAFAMNAGMYHADRTPVGLYVERGRQIARASTSDGPGNFHMKPNGVFAIERGGAIVETTDTFLKTGSAPIHATQSGPMLVIDGALHPRFREYSTSRNIRNGVGVAGSRVVFAISDTPVTFHAFATLFRDVLTTPNALYLDGAISRLHAPNLGRSDPGVGMGPIVAVTVPLAGTAGGRGT